MANIFVIDDNGTVREGVSAVLEKAGHRVTSFTGGKLAIEEYAKRCDEIDLVITDLRMEPMDGVTLLRELQSRYPGLKVILLTAHGTIPDAVRATQSGAFSFLTKPVEKQELLDQVQKALKISGQATIDEDWRRGIVTRSPLMEQKLAQAHLAAGTDARVLLTGEPGSGKEQVARAIHRASNREAAPYVSFSCTSVPTEVLESELFGHLKGAFPGALRAVQRAGFPEHVGDERNVSRKPTQVFGMRHNEVFLKRGNLRFRPGPVQIPAGYPAQLGPQVHGNHQIQTFVPQESVRRGHG
jgi:two-component system response regulator GlrR